MSCSLGHNTVTWVSLELATLSFLVTHSTKSDTALPGGLVHDAYLWLGPVWLN